MTPEELVKVYNPANASLLSPEQINGLRELTSDQIKILAKAYPNMTMNRAYLLIVDGSLKPEKQLPVLSTFENLWNLREKNGQKRFVAFNFKGNYKNIAKAVPTRKPHKTVVMDLSDADMKTLPGIKTASDLAAEDIKVKVTKVKKDETIKDKQ